MGRFQGVAARHRQRAPGRRDAAERGQGPTGAGKQPIGGVRAAKSIHGETSFTSAAGHSSRPLRPDRPAAPRALARLLLTSDRIPKKTTAERCPALPPPRIWREYAGLLTGEGPPAASGSC